MGGLISNASVKKYIYRNEISYRMVISIAKMYWSCQYKKEMLKYGLMLIKPDALIMGKTSEIFSILQEAGYELIYYVWKKIDSVRSAELWKYSWVNTSLECILINQKLFSMHDSLILILRTHNTCKKSACEMLTDLKGSAIGSKRKPYQIREKIKPINYVLNYVHTSDDIDDFLRELGILLDWGELIQAFEAMAINNITAYPNIEEPIISKPNYTLDRWLKKIQAKMKCSNISLSEKKYLMKNIQILKNYTEHKISLNFLRILYRNELIEWDFETLVVLSNNINYLE